LKKVRLKRAGEIEVEPYVPTVFTQNEDYFSKIDFFEALRTRSSKRVIRRIAQERGLPWDDETIRFAQTIINSIVDEIKHEA
jgi:hypothetical protein